MARVECVNCGKSNQSIPLSTDDFTNKRDFGLFMLEQCLNNKCNALLLVYFANYKFARSVQLVYGVTPEFHKQYSKIKVLPKIEINNFDYSCGLNVIQTIYPIDFNIMRKKEETLFHVLDYCEEGEEIRMYNLVEHVAVNKQTINFLRSITFGLEAQV